MTRCAIWNGSIHWQMMVMVEQVATVHDESTENRENVMMVSSSLQDGSVIQKKA